MRAGRTWVVRSAAASFVARRVRQRSRAYYRTESGRKKKSDRNLRRKLAGLRAQQSLAAGSQAPVVSGRSTTLSGSSANSDASTNFESSANSDSLAGPRSSAGRGAAEDRTASGRSCFGRAHGADLPTAAVRADGGESLGRTALGLPEVLELLLTLLRQRSIVLRRRRDYVLEYLHQHPP